MMKRATCPGGSGFLHRDRSLVLDGCDGLPEHGPCQGPPQDGINHPNCGVTLSSPHLPLSSCFLDTPLALVLKYFLQKDPAPPPSLLTPYPSPTLFLLLSSPHTLPPPSTSPPPPHSRLLHLNPIASSSYSSAPPEGVGLCNAAPPHPDFSLRQNKFPVATGT